MVIFTICIAVLLLMAGLAIEGSRLLVERERLKTATEAAALAGALSAEPWLQVMIERSRYQCSTTMDPAGRPVETCGWEYADMLLEGPEAEIVRDWRDRADCDRDDWQCGNPVINCRRVIYPSDTPSVMAQAFSRNTSPAPDVHTALGQVAFDNASGQTQVEASGSLAARLMKLANLDRIEFRQWSIGEAVPRQLGWHVVGTCR